MTENNNHKEIIESLNWIKKELFQQNDFLMEVRRNQIQIEEIMINLLKEYKAIRDFEKKFKSSSK